MLLRIVAMLQYIPAKFTVCRVAIAARLVIKKAWALTLDRQRLRDLQIARIKKPHHFHDGVFSVNSLAVTYFRMQKAYYHWRWFVSRPCSRWEGVG
ncbi:MAG: hypothetical protein Q8Q76_00875, partial [Methylotenera sp.]|nr:hypothetical protein [Methylotenera sp.]